MNRFLAEIQGKYTELVQIVKTRKPVGFMQSCVNFNTAFDYLLMLTIFHVQKVLIILS